MRSCDIAAICINLFKSPQCPNFWTFFFLMDCEFLLMGVWQTHYDYFGGICLQIDHVWNFWKFKKCIFDFLFLDKCQLWLLILGGYEWGNLWDMGLEVTTDVTWHAVGRPPLCSNHASSLELFLLTRVNLSSPAELPRPRRRLTELMVKTALNPPWTDCSTKEWELRFLRSPVEFLPSPDTEMLSGVKLVINKLQVWLANNRRGGWEGLIQESKGTSQERACASSVHCLVPSSPILDVRPWTFGCLLLMSRSELTFCEASLCLTFFSGYIVDRTVGWAHKWARSHRMWSRKFMWSTSSVRFTFLESRSKKFGNWTGRLFGSLECETEQDSNAHDYQDSTERPGVVCCHGQLLNVTVIWQAFRSIGYQSVRIERDQAFDKHKALIPNQNGRIIDQPGTDICDCFCTPSPMRWNIQGKECLTNLNADVFGFFFAGMYCSGWIKRGPIGVILATMNDGFETGKSIVDDLNKGVLIPSIENMGRHTIEEHLRKNGNFWRDVIFGGSAEKENLLTILKLMFVSVHFQGNSLWHLTNGKRLTPMKWKKEPKKGKSEKK